MKEGESFDPVGLVGQIVQGDNTAITAMVERFSRAVHFIIRRHLHDPELAKDAAQETFCTLIKNLRDGKLKDPNALAGYIQGVARNQALRCLRNETREVSIDPVQLDGYAYEGDIYATLEKAELARLVRQLIDELSITRDREILFRYYYEELEKDKLCSSLKVSSSYFDNVVSRARQRLKDLVQARLNPQNSARPTDAGGSEKDERL